MRKLHSMVAVVGLLSGAALAAEEPFDACQVFTQAEAEKAMGTAAAPEPVNPRVKRPKVVTACAYTGFKEGKPIEARAVFKAARTEAETQHAFDEAKLRFATKPMLISGSDASFWSAKTGEMNLRKGRTWLVVTVGAPKPPDRDMEASKALAQLLARKL
jgi:hypothetical protein